MINTQLEVTCIDYTHDGLGVCKHDSLAIFVEDLLVGEQALIEITATKKNYAIAKVVKLITSSPNRVKPVCPYYDKCGGCQLLHFDYAEQVKFKKHLFRRLDQKTFTFEETQMPLAYRNKAVIQLEKKDNVWVGGYFQQKTHSIFEMNNCYLLSSAMNDIQRTLVELLNTYEIKASLYKVMIRESELTKELMIVLFAQDAQGDLQAVIEELQASFEMLTSVYLFTSHKKTTPIFKMTKRLIYGQPYIYDEILNLKFQVSPDSFLQVNRFQTAKLYETVIELGQFTKQQNVLELYCGIGTISLSIASKVKKVVGIELVNAAIKDAKNNAKLNSITNAKFFCQDAKLYEPEESFDTIIVDPPRKGLEAAVIDKLIEMQPEKIIYISCDLQTQMRDVQKLEVAGYKIIKVVAQDMFAQSYHVESVMLLSRVEE